MAALALLLAPATVSAAEPTFEPPTAEATFGTGIVFTQAFTSPVPLARVELLLEYPESIGPFVVEVSGAEPAGRRELVHRLSIAEDGHIVPNTRITARWRLVPADRSIAPSVGPPVQVLYADTRFTWRTLEGDLVRLHWYEGSDAFGRRALEIGERGVREASDFLGVAETDPVDFFVYADQGAFYDAVGPSARENIAGSAYADIRTMLAWIEPYGAGTSPEVARVVPHELTHLVFDAAVRNPYHFPPRWLNEGVAVYLTEGFTPSDRAAVAAAAADDRLMPLQALGGRFPTTYGRFFLAYAESTSAVDFLVGEKGTEALVSLIRSYAAGVTDDEAFNAAIGMDLGDFEQAWLDHLGAAAPIRYGPQPAPAGPLPPSWSDGSNPPPAAGPGVASSPPEGAAGSPAPADDTAGSPLGDAGVLVVVGALGLLVGGAIGYAWRRRSAGASSAPGP